ncbi:MAG TPA: TldD/PmbA family protein [archaeon]|nr:TldD/PmbA family protein [archaeon]
MIDLKTIKGTCQELLEFTQKQSEVKEAEAYVSCNTLNVYRIAYHSKIPSNGLEEPKSDENFGLSLRILFKDGKYGMGTSDSNLSKEGFREAYSKAFASRVLDTDFHSLASPAGKMKSKSRIDPKIIKTDEKKGVAKAYEMLEGAFSEIKKSAFSHPTNITGELDLLASRFCVANSNGIFAADENTSTFCTLTTSLEAEQNATGTSFESSSHISKLNTKIAGQESVQKALAMQNPRHMESGKYKVVLSESVVAELFYSRFDLDLSSVDYHATAFPEERMDKKIASEQFSVTDDPTLKGAMGSKIVSDEGIPTRKVDLIKDGVLVNYLSNDYYSKKKNEWAKYAPLHGFRSGTERNYNSDVGIGATNIVVAKGKHSQEELISEVKNGIFVGRLWYTYPVNGYASPDFTSTIRGDSYIIENGKIVGALTPNTMRVLDSFDNFMKNIIAIGKEQKAIQAWGQEEIVITPQIALSEMNLKRISTGLY